MNIKLIAIDIDGTLVDSHHQISDENKKAIQAAHKKGVKIILTSGRPYFGISPALELLGLQEADCLAISNNGALVHNAKTGETLHENLLTHQDYLLFSEFAKKQDLPFHAISDNKIYTSNKAISPYTVHESYLTNTPLFFRAEDEINPHLTYSKIMLCHDKTQLDLAQKQLPDEIIKNFNIYRSTDFFIECLSKKASKGIAVQFAAKYFNIAPENIMVIGDQYNDLSMFEFADCKVAMGNAIKELKQQATFVTTTNDESGVAVAINKFVLNQE